jgi:transcription elongation factor Elf1
MWLEQKYIGIVSGRLDRFKRVNNTTFNFRCPVCGDSQKNKYKARGYLFPKDKGGHLYHCHNCHVTLGFDKLLQHIDPLVYSDYVKESIAEKYGGEKPKSEVEVFAEKMKTPVFIKMSELKSLKKISQLQYNHPAKEYIESRLIPTSMHHKLFYTPKFKQFVNSVVPNKFEDIDNDEPRLIIPFIDKEKMLFGFQGRSFKKDGIRYITIMIRDDMPKVFNLDQCDQTKQHFIFEGPIDSMFVSNSLAMAGQSINWSVCNEHTVFVFDNEPRSKETCAKIEQAINKGYGVVLLPHSIVQKDINDLVMAYPNIDIDRLLVDNIYSGLTAKLQFQNWRKL